MTWNEIYNRAIDCACGDWRLKAKDYARGEVREFVMLKKNYDIETAEIPEDEIDYYCKEYDIEFSDNGSIKTWR